MSSAAKVGAFMLASLAIMAFFILKIEDINVRRHGVRKISAVFTNVAGLDDKSAVRIAGVRKGKVTSVHVGTDGRARVNMEIDDDVPLHTNATAKVANLGLLGEKYIDINPGSQNLPVIPEQQSVTLNGTEPASMDDITNQVASIANDVKAITTSLRGAIGGPGGQQRLEDIVENVRTITTQVREIIRANQSNVDATMANARIVSEQLKTEIPRLAASIDHVASTIGGTVSENRADTRKVVENLRDLSKDLRTTADNLNDITGHVKSGEGTVGKLLYSNEAHDKLTNALSSVESGVNELRTTLGRATRIQMDVGISGDYYAGLKQTATTDAQQSISGNARSGVNLRIIPNPERNRFYNLVLADDPRGHRVEKVFENTVTAPNGTTTTTTTHEVKFDRNFLVSAQAGWALGDFGVRVGLFDNSGGAGVDYRYNDRLRFTGEAFDFGSKRDDKPHVRGYAEYVIRRETARTPTIFVTSGFDNPLNDRAFTFGGGIRWRDDDLKYLLSSVPLGK
jgi:phospholipid/cholesterol/gamma-HCH transport system substrate-binding protein